MKPWLKVLLPFVVALGIVGIAWAQNTANMQCSSMAISATTTPVQISPAGWRYAYIKPRASASQAMYAFLNYSNTAPVAVPTACSSPGASFSTGNGCFEVPTGVAVTIGCGAGGCTNQQATLWAVLETAGTDKVDICTGW